MQNRLFLSVFNTFTRFSMHLYSYSFGAFPTYELLKNKNIPVDSIILHEKLEKSKDLENILKLAKSRNIKIITNGKLIEKLSSKGNIYIVGVFKKYDKNPKR